MEKFDIANEIQHQIDDHIRMREGAMKLMSACSTLNQALETSKNLLTINARILGLMSALQKKKQQHVLEEYNRQRSSVYIDPSQDACLGRIAISDIRVPLMWKDNVHFSGKTGDQSYYAFALIRCGDQVRDTSLYEITSADTDMYFDETLIFNDLSPDFKMDFEVYYTVISSNEAHPVRQPRSSITIWNTRKPVHFNAPKFCLAGHVHLTVDDIRIGIISKDLMMSGKGASGVAVLGDIHEFPVHPLELWGQFCCEIAAQPTCMVEKSAHCDCQLMVGEDEWCDCYAELFQCAIYCWKDRSLAGISKPDYYMRLLEDWIVSVDDSGGGSTLNIISNDYKLLSLRFENEKDCFQWKFSLRKEICNLTSWKVACREKMRIEEHRKIRLSIPSTASFYEQIDIGKESDGIITKSPSNGSSLLNGVKNHLPSPINETTETIEVPDVNIRDSVFVDTSITPALENAPDSDKLITSLPEESPIISSERSFDQEASEIVKVEVNHIAHDTSGETLDDSSTDLDQHSLVKTSKIEQNIDTNASVVSPSDEVKSNDTLSEIKQEELKNLEEIDISEECKESNHQGPTNEFVNESVDLENGDTSKSITNDSDSHIGINDAHPSEDTANPNSSSDSSIDDSNRFCNDDLKSNVNVAPVEQAEDISDELKRTDLDDDKILSTKDPTDIFNDAKIDAGVNSDLNSSNVDCDVSLPESSNNKSNDKNISLEENTQQISSVDISDDFNAKDIDESTVQSEELSSGENKYDTSEISEENVDVSITVEAAINSEPESIPTEFPECDKLHTNSLILNENQEEDKPSVESGEDLTTNDELQLNAIDSNGSSNLGEIISSDITNSTENESQGVVKEVSMDSSEVKEIIERVDEENPVIDNKDECENTDLVEVGSSLSEEFCCESNGESKISHTKDENDDTEKNTDTTAHLASLEYVIAVADDSNDNCSAAKSEEAISDTDSKANVGEKCVIVNEPSSGNDERSALSFDKNNLDGDLGKKESDQKFESEKTDNSNEDSLLLSSSKAIS